jgi:hypothetical protein
MRAAAGCGEASLQARSETEAVMEAVLRIDTFLKKAKTSWMTPFMGGAFAGLFLFWV